METGYLRRSAARRFQPFRFWIQPNYGTILLDAGLLADESDWPELLRALDNPRYLTDGITCSVLSYNLDSGAHVVAWPDWNGYTSRPEHFLAEIALESLPLARAFPAGCRPGKGLKASFGIRAGGAGLQFFMRIDSQWWRARWAATPEAEPPFDETADSLNGVVNLTVALLPHAEFQHLYNWRPMRRGVSSKQRVQTLAALEWKTDYEPMGSIQGYGISHRYVSVTHEAVDQVM